MHFPWTFPELITGRKFDLFQSGLEARFNENRIGYKITYGEPTAKPVMWMDYETDSAIGRVTLWESGECDMEVVDAESRIDLLRETHTFPNVDAFFDSYPRVPNLVYTHSFGPRMEED